MSIHKAQTVMTTSWDNNQPCSFCVFNVHPSAWVLRSARGRRPLRCQTTPLGGSRRPPAATAPATPPASKPRPQPHRPAQIPAHSPLAPPTAPAGAAPRRSRGGREGTTLSGGRQAKSPRAFPSKPNLTLKKKKKTHVKKLPFRSGGRPVPGTTRRARGGGAGAGERSRPEPVGCWWGAAPPRLFPARWGSNSPTDWHLRPAGYCSTCWIFHPH